MESAGQQHYLLFVWQPTGYRLFERDGEVPEVGAELEIDGRTERVAKIGASPLPGDSRRCVYLIG